MCGIAGLVSFTNPAMPRDIIARMTRALAHRGPDGEGIEVRDHAQFGHRRLAVRDLSKAGRQPLFDSSGAIMVTFNGEIYNDAALRADIEAACGYRFRSRCDTEVIPIGWRLWGEGLFARLEGMFAIAIWDAERRVLVLARDRVGIKPLYHAKAGDAHLFASEVKSILASGLVRDVIDPAAFHTYLATGYPDPEDSLISGVHQVPPGSFAVIDAAGERVHRYWAPARGGEIREREPAVESVRGALEKSCSDLLLSDVPVGLMLSSGIDSALIALLLRDHSIPAYTARFDDASFDEGSGAQHIAAEAGHPWHPIAADGAAGIARDFEAVAVAVDGELADSSALAHYAVCRALRAQVTVALAGDGADEFFGGYDTYAATQVAGTAGRLVPPALARPIAQRLAALGARREDRLPKSATLARFFAGLAAPEGAPHAEWRRLTGAGLLSDLYGAPMREVAEQDPLARYRAAFLEAEGGLVDRALLADQTYYLPADMLAKVDRISMAHGLEIRVPFLERPVMECAGSIAPGLLAPLLGPTKGVLRDLARSLGMPEALVAQRKRGFNVPIARLLRHDLSPLADRYLDADADLFAPLLSPDGVRRLWREHRDMRADHSYTLWALLVNGVARARRG